jgi:hypothetical protein
LKTILLGVLLLTLSACVSASKQAAQSAPPPTAPAPAAPVAEAKPSETSDVLARKDAAVKCPKRAKLVKGKCLMQVEETE